MPGATLAVVGFLTWKTIQLRRAPVRTGREGLVGETARVVRGFGESEPAGTVLVHGEYWDASGPAGLERGEAVRVAGVEGFRLRVERRI